MIGVSRPDPVPSVLECPDDPFLDLFFTRFFKSILGGIFIDLDLNFGPILESKVNVGAIMDFFGLC